MNVTNTDDWFRDEAREEYSCDDIQVDDDANVTYASQGAWVQAWVYIPYPHED